MALPSDPPTRVLHVGTDEGLLRDAVSSLPSDQRPLEVSSVSDANAARHHLEGSAVDCVVCETADVAWRSVLEVIEATDPTPPSLVVTGSETDLEAALSFGASDVVLRRDGVDEGRILGRRLGNVVPGVDESEEREAAELTFADVVLDTLDDVFYLVDTEGQFRRWNRRLREVTGYSDADIAEMNATDIVAEEDRDRVLSQMEAVLDGDSTTISVDVEARDGERVPFEITGARLTDDEGEPAGIVGIGRDISDREALEAELEKKASLLDHIFDQIPTALYVKDEEGQHIRMSEYDRNPVDKGGLTDPEIYGETEFTQETYADDMRVIEEGERIINKEEYNPNNEEWTLTSKVPWRDEDGDIRGLIGVSRFITEKKEYEQELRLRDRAMAAAPIGITIHDASDASTPITYANDSFLELTGHDQDAVTGEDFSLLVGPDTAPEKVEALETAFQAGEVSTVVLLLYGADDSPFWGRVTVAPVTDDEGAVTHFVGFLQDVTETKERAEEIERRLDEFGDVLAQELRTPLETAQAALEGAPENDDPEITTARRSVERVDKLIDDLSTVHSFSVKSRSVFDESQHDTTET